MSIPAKLLLVFVFAVSVSFAASPRWSLGGSLPYFLEDRSTGLSVDVGYRAETHYVGLDFLSLDYHENLSSKRLTAETLVWRFHVPFTLGRRKLVGYGGLGAGSARVRTTFSYVTGGQVYSSSWTMNLLGFQMQAGLAVSLLPSMSAKLGWRHFEAVGIALGPSIGAAFNGEAIEAGLDWRF